MADVALASRVFAPHYAAPQACACQVPWVELRSAPHSSSLAVSQLLYGEGFGVLDLAGDWAWGRCLEDGYVGYLPRAALGPVGVPTHRVSAAIALLFAAPDIKAPVLARWPLGARFAGEAAGAFVGSGEGFVHARHTAPIEALDKDWVGVAERLLGQPYLWGGRGGGGVDCSGLVQVALGAAGIAAPRDSDLQQAALGRPLAEGEKLDRGDLVFLPGHVGLMADAERLLHANAHWMAVTIEPLADVLARTPEATPIMRRIEP